MATPKQSNSSAASSKGNSAAERQARELLGNLRAAFKSPHWELLSGNLSMLRSRLQQSLLQASSPEALYRLQGQIHMLDYLIDGKFEALALGSVLAGLDTAAPVSDYMSRDSDSNPTDKGAYDA